MQHINSFLVLYRVLLIRVKTRNNVYELTNYNNHLNNVMYRTLSSTTI